MAKATRPRRSRTRFNEEGEVNLIVLIVAYHIAPYALVVLVVMVLLGAAKS